jgi:exonuclease SbcC
MIPIHLTISGFLSYRDPVELDFTKFSIACISGPNGAGKSSLLDAITFALFGQARTNDDSLINANPEVSAAQVTFTFSHEGNTYRVQRVKPRDKNTLLEFQIQGVDKKWKALTERTLRDTETHIRQTLRLDYETFVNASFFLQGKADLFTQQRPTDRKRILSTILGLEIWEQYRARAADKRKSIENEIEALQGRLTEINLELSQEGDRKKKLSDLESRLALLTLTRASLEKSLKEIRRRAAAVEAEAASIAALASALERGQTQVAELSARLAERKEEQAGFASLIERTKEVEKAFAAWEKLRTELREWDGVASRFHEQELRRSKPLSAIEAEKARLQTELHNLHEVYKALEDALVNKPKLVAELKTLVAQISKLDTQVAEREKLETNLDVSRKAESKATAENPLLKDQMLVLRARIDVMKKATGAVCPTCGQELTEDHRLKTITQLELDGKEMGDRHRANQKALIDATSNVKRFETLISEIARKEEELGQKKLRATQVQTYLDDLEKIESDWEKDRAPRLKEIEKSLEKENYAAEARAELAAIDKELKVTGYDAAQHDATRKKELAARSAETEMRGLDQAKGAAKPVEREIKDLEKQVADRTKEVADQQTAHEQAAAAFATVQAGMPDLQTAEREMLAAQEQENQTRQEVGAAKQEVDVLDTLRLRKKEIDEQRDQLAGRVGQYQSLERAFGKDGVPAMLIEQALPQIEIKANEILDRLTNGSMRINFITQEAYKNKRRDDMRETLEIQISDSAGVRDYEMFSGGEAFRINFAIRLALSEVLAQRAGARLQTLVIDEGFGSQDEAGRQRLVETIGLVRSDFEKILVITHIDALKDAFPNRIEVEKGPRGSTLRVM